MWHSWVRSALLALSGLLALFLGYLVVTRMEAVQTPRSFSPGAFDRADAGIDQFTFMQSKAGAVQWEVRAQRAHVVEAAHEALLEGVHATLYGPKGWELRLQGDEGTIDTVTKNFMLVRHEAPIVVEFQGGYTIYTNHLSWTDGRREVSSADPVTISGQGVEITGRGLIAKLDQEEFQVLDDVRVEISQ